MKKNRCKKEAFESYVKRCTEVALKTEYYDPGGNSPLATYNKTFSQSIVYSTKSLYKDLKYVLTLPVTEVGLTDFLSALIAIPLFPVFVFLRAICEKRHAKKELMIESNELLNLGYL